MAEVYDRWHKSRPGEADKPCGEHTSKTRKMVASSEHGQGKRWQVRWRDASGKQCKENFAKKAAADKRADEVQADLDRGTYVDPERKKQDFRTFAEEWRTSATHRERTEVNVERALRLHVYPTFGNRPPAAINRTDVRAWVKERSQVLAPISLRTPWNALTAVMSAAVADGIITSNPCHGVELPEPRNAEVVPLEPLVVKALMQAASDRYRAAVRLDGTTGLRGGELFGLEDHHIDLDTREVIVEQQLIGPDKGVPYLGPPKTDKSYRTGRLSASAAEAIKLHREMFPPREVEIEDRTDPRKPKWRKARLLFLSEANAPVRRGSWAKTWARIVRRADKLLEEWGSPLRVPEGATLHDLRHFYASVLIKHGATVKKVQRLLGHAKPSITWDLYVHLWEDDEDDTADIMDAVLA
ncbi:tyrosine-type recombinase/integrase [Streptomyces sp. NPDC018045]|uniref:tyrosine-type recombinase/integrase n=1 Tax=Streptomyces sp. NPDC018045 TaxID=3365037 RepID=UPI00379CACF6